MSMEIEKEALIYLEAVLEKKIESVVALKVDELTSVADVFIIGSGRSTRQVKAVSEHVRRALSKKGKKPLAIDGEKEGDWVLLDYGDIVIHLFYEPTRRFYDLEGLWMDAEKICGEFIDAKSSESVFEDEEDDYWIEGDEDYEEY